MIEKLEDDNLSGKRIVQFRNEKLRGDVAIEKSFSYVRQKGSSYEDLLDSIEVVDEETVKLEKQQTQKRNTYYADKFVIEVIKETVKTQSLDLTSLTKRVSKDTGQSIEICRGIIDRYSGSAWGDYTFWKIHTGNNNRKTLELVSELPETENRPKPKNP